MRFSSVRWNRIILLYFALQSMLSVLFLHISISRRSNTEATNTDDSTVGAAAAAGFRVIIVVVVAVAASASYDECKLE